MRRSGRASNFSLPCWFWRINLLAMSWEIPSEPFVDCPRDAPVETVVIPRTRDLGDGFQVRRALPSVRKRMVGPFIFFDEMGPVQFAPGKGLDVRPHPHIGLATVTYLFEGEILHRDSLGVVQSIRPGEVNWMTAGRGIVHSERTPPQPRERGDRLSGIQLWVALPHAHEEDSPSFVHHAASALPVIEDRNVRLRVIVGELHGARSPVKTLSAMFYADAALEAGAELALPPDYEERAVFVSQGSAMVGGETFEAGRLLVLRPGLTHVLKAVSPTRLLLLGGEPMDGPRHIYWNLVSSSRGRIEEAKQEWRAGRFPQVPGETEFIPLPDDAPVARYP